MDDAVGFHLPNHAACIEAELAWLERVIETRLKHFFAGSPRQPTLPAAPHHSVNTVLGGDIARYALGTEERIVLALAIAPHVNSAVLDPFYVKNTAIDRVFSQFGGHYGPQGMQPTAETALFLIAGADTGARIRAMRYFDPDGYLRARLGLQMDRTDQNASTYSATLDLSVHRIVALCTGVQPQPNFSPDFPARKLSSGLDWSDLVLPPELLHQLGHMTSWLTHRQTILQQWGLGRQFSAGFKALFYGPPGTGKTLTATLLGKATGLDVYRIDLSMVVSKYIGETEKNLRTVFDMAAEQDWILFFDEADALFGARTATTSSNDRHANQEVAYLLQRIEDCNSLVILATNLRSNIDDAFFRRFQMLLGFVRPDARQRQQIWANVLRDVPCDPGIDLTAIARDHDLSGASITNVARHASISALRRNASHVSLTDMKDAIASEMRKEGRTK
ncbi:MAG: ATP-binding protein [Pseudomonadota bacterium]